MPSPQTQRSAYRERRINVMLQESSSPAGTNAQAPAVEKAPETPALPAARRSTRSILYIFLATALLCAAAMFFLLFRHDASETVKNVPVQPVQTQAPQVPAAAQHAPPADAFAKPEISSATTSESKPVAGKAERIRFKLRRTSKCQKFGPLNLKLVATNARRGTCNILFASADQAPSQHIIQMNRPLQVEGTDGSRISLTVNGITRDSVNGYVETH